MKIPLHLILGVVIPRRDQAGQASWVKLV